jgi:hypothetical protein
MIHSQLLGLVLVLVQVLVLVERKVPIEHSLGRMLLSDTFYKLLFLKHNHYLTLSAHKIHLMG